MIGEARTDTTGRLKLDHAKWTAIRFVTPLVDVCLIPWAVLNASTLQLGLYIFGNPTLDTHGIHAAYISSCLAVRIPVHRTGEGSGRRLTCPLPPSNPARLGVNQRDDPIKICRSARLDTVRRAFQLSMLVGQG